MLEQTKAVYQLVLDTEKKYDEEKERLLIRKKELEKKLNNKLPFSSPVKKREARYEIEEIDFSLQELSQEKKQAINKLDLLHKIKKAHDEDCKWEVPSTDKIRKLFSDFENNLIHLMHQSSKETDQFIDEEKKLSNQLLTKTTENEIKCDKEIINPLPFISIKQAIGEFYTNNELAKIKSKIHSEFDLRRIWAKQAAVAGIRNQSTQEERDKEIKEKGGYHICEGNFVIVDNNKYNDWCNKEWEKKRKGK